MSLFKAPNRFVPLIHSLSFWGSPLGFPFLSSRFFSGSSQSTFMEVVMATLKNASSSYDSVAITAENNCYSYAHLISSAWSICNDLCNGNFKSNIEESKYENSIKTNNKADNLLGARVGIVAKPSAEFVAGVLGTWLCGGVAVPLAVSYPVTELLYVMKDSDISLILSTQEHQEIMEKVASDCSSNFSLLPSVTRVPAKTGLPESVENEFHLISKLIEEMFDSRKAEGDEPALILYTSGTTGKPKGVVHTHKGIISQVQILTEAWEYTSSDHFLHCLPLHHVHGLFNALLAPIYAGAVIEFMPKFSVRGVWQRWRESYPDNGSKVDDAITLFTGVPTMYSRLLQGYETMDSDLKTASASAARQLRLMMCGSSALPYPIMKQWEDVTGHRLLERYGMTEFVMALSNPLHGTRKAGTVGKPLPRVEVKIVGEDGTSTDGVGELCVRSPSLFKEYWRQPKVTKESFIDDGFFKTGDTVTVDEDGYHVILGRSNADIMKVGGYKLSALEIEAVLLEHPTTTVPDLARRMTVEAEKKPREDMVRVRHPAVSECCVVGLQDNYYGEIVSAIIIINEDLKKIADHQLKPAITLKELQEWAKEKLAPYKIPTKLFLWDTLPRNAMGKVNKKEIRKLLEN